jgi:malonyl-CoA/methylmalonyl-CoA synthetase
LLTGCQLLLEDAFHPVDTLQVIGRASVFMAVPTIYYKFLEQPEFRSAAKTWSQVRHFTCGSAPIRPEVLPELEAILDRPILNRYGMTEAFVITSLPLPHPNTPSPAGGGPRWGSVGLPLEGVEVRLTNVQDNVGTVSIRGPNLFREYWGKPDATRAAFESGWFDTGDLGTLDAAGFLTLVGRKHDLIITSGFNVYPQVVERVLNECAGVRESAVVGVADRHRGERVVAFVVKGDGILDAQRLLAHCAERLVNYQQPTEVLFVDALPRNAMGKVLRRELQKTVVYGGS